MKSQSVCVLLFSAAIVAAAGATTLPKHPPLTKQAYAAQKAQIDAQLEANRKLCGNMKGNTQDICEVEAKARADALKAELEARYKPSPESIFQSRSVTAEANYAVAKAKCSVVKGTAKDRCTKDAKAAREAALRQAKVEKVQETGGAFANGGARAHRHLQDSAS
ncbi:hypothetical protein JJB11_12980 [Ramlibacter ginsenosidimutans]|uniref:DUF1090 domain-containing protein n=1 Tax=Ramlibacter ginsenosidimutans TaxID=502333 RepID=A0A934WMZ7_9BURK|nr:hypothetical protein [Ramlibacter ginsenosidimutans]MBK6007008.1 hypothetical protein [Ramlibacter ginsenosidimutans]